MNWRLLLATGRARYAEAMERVLWNTIAGAVSRNGTGSSTPTHALENWSR